MRNTANSSRKTRRLLNRIISITCIGIVAGLSGAAFILLAFEIRRIFLPTQELVAVEQIPDTKVSPLETAEDSADIEPIPRDNSRPDSQDTNRNTEFTVEGLPDAGFLVGRLWSPPSTSSDVNTIPPPVIPESMPVDPIPENSSGGEGNPGPIAQVPTPPPNEAINTEAITTVNPIQSSVLNSALEEYHIWSLRHRKATFQQQLLKGNVLFAIVLSILAFGLYLSYVQFKKGGQTEGSLKLGPAGIEITSSILGVLVLAFSTAFFYLYLIHVFPIEEIGQSDQPIEVNAETSESEE